MKGREAFNGTNVRRWMRRELETDGMFYGPPDQINATLLAENAAEYFGVKDKRGPLDDPNHWIWEIALDEANAYEQREPK